MSDESDMGTLRVIDGDHMDIELPVIDSYLKHRVIARIIEADLRGVEAMTTVIADLAFVVAALFSSAEEPIRPWEVLESVGDALTVAHELQRARLDTGKSDEEEWGDICAEVVRVADQGRAAMIEKLGRELESEGRRRWIKRQTS